MGFCREDIGCVGIEERSESFILRISDEVHEEVRARIEVEYEHLSDILTALREMKEDQDLGEYVHNDRRTKEAAAIRASLEARQKKAEAIAAMKAARRLCREAGLDPDADLFTGDL